MDINVFILSQKGDAQDELILSSAPAIEKATLIEHLYLFYSDLKEKESFFRMNKSIVVVYYWKTNMPEPGTNRRGLYVILGFTLEDSPTNINDTIHHFIFYSTKFFEILEYLFKISLLEDVSDKFFEILQDDIDSEVKKATEEFKRLKLTRPKIQLKNHFFKSNFHIQKQKNTIMYIHMLNDSPDFYKNWAVFSQEALSLLYTTGTQDVSTLKSYTPQSLIILENGEKIPPGVLKVETMKYQDCNYLLILY